MKFNVITLMPDLISTALEFGVVGSAFKNEICTLNLINPRSFSQDAHHTVDDRPFGGGDGMLMLAEPLQKSLEQIENRDTVYYLSPQGETFNESLAQSLAQKSEVTLICGRYGGVDHRFMLQNKIVELSLGDFVLSGGELAALAVIDAVTRKIPGVLGHGESAEQDSFAQGWLEAPHFTRPQNWKGFEIPPVLVSGDHKKIAEHRKWMSVVVTLLKRPDLVDLKNGDWKALGKYISQAREEDFLAYGFTKEELLNLVQGKPHDT